MLRHSCGYVLVNKGVDVRVIQDFLGHRSISSTVRYTKLNRSHQGQHHSGPGLQESSAGESTGMPCTRLPGLLVAARQPQPSWSSSLLRLIRKESQIQRWRSITVERLERVARVRTDLVIRGFGFVAWALSVDQRCFIVNSTKDPVWETFSNFLTLRLPQSVNN